MELTIKIEYQELLKLIRQLPHEQLDKLKEELAIGQTRNPEKLEDLIQSAPTMTDQQYQQYLTARDEMNKWREL